MFGTTLLPTIRERLLAWMSFLAMRPLDWPITRSWGGQERFKEPTS